MTNDPSPPPSSSPWLPDAEPPAGQRAALHRLAEAFRRTIELLMDSNAQEEQLLQAADALDAFGDRLEAAPGGRALWGFAETATAGNPRAFFDNSPLAGAANPVAPPLRMAVVGNEVEARVTFGRAYEGPPGHIHGGFVAAAFDEVLGFVQTLSGVSGMTGTLTVRYRRPSPLYRELHLQGRIERIEGRKIFTSGALRDGETLLAEAEAVFVNVGRERFRDLAATLDSRYPAR